MCGSTREDLIAVLGCAFVLAELQVVYKLLISILYHGCTNYNFDKYTYGKHGLRVSYKIDTVDITTYK